MRKTSSQLTTANGGLQFAPGPVIFHTLPWPVTPSLAQRFPCSSKVRPLTPGTPETEGVVMVGGLPALGLKLKIRAPAPSATNRSPMSLKAMPAKPQVERPDAGSMFPTVASAGLLRLICQTGHGGAPEPATYKLR